MKNTLNKFNFILGILTVIIAYFPGMLIGEFAIIFIKAIGTILNIIIGFIESFWVSNSSKGCVLIPAFLSNNRN